MTHFCTEGAPLGVGAAISEFDEVEGILDIGLELVYRHVGAFFMVLELAYEAYAEHGQRLGSDFL